VKRIERNATERMRVAVVFLCMACILRKASALRPTALITGSTDGIGLTTAKNLAAKGYDVIIHGRDASRVEQAAKAVRSFVESRSNDPGIPLILTLPPVDICTVEGCKQLATDVEVLCNANNLQLSVLMNNAGVYAEKHIVTTAGLEQTFAVNVLAPFVITSYLLPLLLKQKSRIVIASSMSQCQSIRFWDDLQYSKRSYSAHGAYSESKLLDAMLTIEMADRFQMAGIDTDRIICNCLDPGTVNTKMLLAGWGRIGIEVEDALNETWLCSSDQVESTTGKYFIGRSERKASSSAYDQKERDKLWSLLSGLSPEAAAMWKFD
jgi:NAD(P)-dependent dehydrogenase (short-subunit alcohol dehydrogenase family)